MAIFLPVFWCTKSVKFHFRWGTRPRDQKQETGNDCDVISRIQASRKTDFSDISYFSFKQRTILPFLSELISSQYENDWKICFSRSLKSIPSVIPSVLFLVSRFCTPPEMKFDAFGISKHGKGKSLSKFFLSYTYKTLRRFNRAN